MLFKELAEKFNSISKALGELIKDKKFDEALKELTKFEGEVKPMLNSCEMTCSDFADREKFNLSLRDYAMDTFNKSSSVSDKKTSAEMYNLAQKEIYELWTSWKAVIQQFVSTLDQWRSGIMRAKQQEENEQPKKA